MQCNVSVASYLLSLRLPPELELRAWPSEVLLSRCLWWLDLREEEDEEEAHCGQLEEDSEARLWGASAEEEETSMLTIESIFWLSPAHCFLVIL